MVSRALINHVIGAVAIGGLIAILYLTWSMLELVRGITP